MDGGGGRIDAEPVERRHPCGMLGDRRVQGLQVGPRRHQAVLDVVGAGHRRERVEPGPCLGKAHV